MVPIYHFKAKPVKLVPHVPGTVIVQAGSGSVVSTCAYLPMPHTVLAQIAVFRAHTTDVLGAPPEMVIISAAEHKALQAEIGAKGQVQMVDGLTVIVDPVESMLPKAVDWAPGLDPLKESNKAPKQVWSEYGIEYEGDGEPTKLVQLPSTPFGGKFSGFKKPFTKEDMMFGFTSIEPKGMGMIPPGTLLFDTPKQLGVITNIEEPEPTVSDLAEVPKGDYTVFIHAPSDYGDPDDEEGTELGQFQPEPVSPKPKKVYHKSGSDEHGTPQALFDTLNKEFKFDLDVCASEAHEVPYHMEDGGTTAQLDPGNAKCPIYFTQETNGLAQDWFGSVWMNPPYTKGQVQVWIKKLVSEMLADNTTHAVALVAARPDTAWFQFAVSYAYEIRFLKGRLTFEGSKDPAPFPSALLLFDRKVNYQFVRFWDWKKGLAVKYFKGAGMALGSGSGLKKPMGHPLSKLLKPMPYKPGDLFALD